MPATSARHLLQSHKTEKLESGTATTHATALLKHTSRRSGGTDAVLVHWPHGYMGPIQAKDFSDQCGFPCKQSSSDDGAAFEQADVIVNFPIDETPPKNERGAASIAMTMESMSLYGGNFADRYDAVSNLNWQSTIPWVLMDPMRLHGGIKHAWDSRPSWDERKPAAVFVARNCNMQKGRREFLEKLVEYGVPVESISDCKPANTTGEWPADVPRENKELAIAKYRVYLALENVPEAGYVTEKLQDGLQAGCVTVYLGAPDIGNYIPESGIINANSLNMDEISSRIKNAIADKNSWYTYRKWADQSPREWNDGKVYQAFSWSSQMPHMCRFCRFGFAKRMGLAWDRQARDISGNVTIPPKGHHFWELWRSSAPPSMPAPASAI
jgi:hypothetical protein